MQIRCLSTNWILGYFKYVFQLKILDGFVEKLKFLQIVVGLYIFVYKMTVTITAQHCIMTILSNNKYHYGVLIVIIVFFDHENIILHIKIIRIG